ncbi:MAG: AraC family transcriptional regulator [Acidobacteriota bacterium]
MTTSPASQANWNPRLREIYLKELIDHLQRLLPGDGHAEPVVGLHLFRVSSPTDLRHGVLEPALCVIAQGAKELTLSGRRYRYDPYHYLIVTLGLPVTTRVVEASPERPYLSLRFDLAPELVGSVLVQSGYRLQERSSPVAALDVSPLETGLLESVVRYVRLARDPEEARVLAPLVRREIVFRLLQGAQGDRLQHVAVLHGKRHRISRAIARMRREFDRPLRVEDLAREAGMSLSAFYQHFRAVTGMTPLQFQKRLRLYTARERMILQDLDAATAAFEVGYESPSHFSREYKRLFGASPARDVQRLRRTLLGAAG